MFHSSSKLILQNVCNHSCESKWVFHSYAGIYSPLLCQIHNLILNRRNNWVCIFHLISPFSSSTLLLGDKLAPHSCPEFWRVSGWAKDSRSFDSFGGAEHSATWFAYHFESGSFVEWLLFECFYLPFGIGPRGYHHPNFHPHSCKWGSSVPIHIILVLIMLHWAPGVQLAAVIVSLAGGMGQSFLISKRLLDILLALGQGILAWIGGIFKGWGLFSGVWAQGSLTLSICWGLGACLQWLHAHFIGFGSCSCFCFKPLSVS